MSRPGSQKCERLRLPESQWQDDEGVGTRRREPLHVVIAATVRHGGRVSARSRARQSEGNTKMSAERPILIVDDDGVLRETLADQLAVDGEFTASRQPPSARPRKSSSAKDARFDAVILDVGLPDGDGRDLCTRLRKQGQKMPIIMLTGSARRGQTPRRAGAGSRSARASRDLHPGRGASERSGRAPDPRRGGPPATPAHPAPPARRTRRPRQGGRRDRPGTR